jgi:penicillin G amidase
VNRLRKIGLIFVAAVFILIFIASFYINSLFNSSLPLLDGTISASISNAASINRDKQGYAKIKAESWHDAYFALGFAHGQDRFFYMDLARKSVSGKLSELFGSRTVEYDLSIRIHQFEQRAQHAVDALSADKLDLIKFYIAGVNHGLSTLSDVPFEYQILSASPEPWTEKDIFLVIFSMYLSLQDSDGEQEYQRLLAAQSIEQSLVDFIFPKGSKIDAPIDESVVSVASVPELPTVVSIKPKKAAVSSSSDGQQKSHSEVPQKSDLAAAVFDHSIDFLKQKKSYEQVVGSNNWAVSGSLTQDGRAILADDMHLGLGVPNIWYRADIEVSDGEINHLHTGVSLPGVPGIVVGSNQSIAWGFTNSYGDWHDLIPISLNPDNQIEYLMGDQYVAINTIEQELIVKDEESVLFTIETTELGPIVKKDEEKNIIYVLQWVAHDTEGLNLDLLELNNAKNVQQAIQAANGAGIPAQNMLVVDNLGHIAWTIAGAIPKRIRSGYIPKLDNGPGWQSYLNESDYPKVINPPSGRLWTANSRVVGSDMLNHIGDGGYASAYRARQIKRALFEKALFSEKDLLDIQLDDRAIYLRPWLIYLMTSAERMPMATKEALLEIVNQWDGRATPNSQAYYLLKEFRSRVSAKIIERIEQVVDHDEFDYRAATRQWEHVVHQVLTAKKTSWLPAPYQSFEALLDDMVKEAWQDSEYGNKIFKGNVQLGHVFSRMIPGAGFWLALDEEQVPGDIEMPRVGGRSFGASQRLVVSPGLEKSALFHMPAGQVGNPNSPFWGAGHLNWLEGNPAPLQLDNFKHQLILEPEVDHE